MSLSGYNRQGWPKLGTWTDHLLYLKMKGSVWIVESDM